MQTTAERSTGTRDAADKPVLIVGRPQAFGDALANLLTQDGLSARSVPLAAFTAQTATAGSLDGEGLVLLLVDAGTPAADLSAAVERMRQQRPEMPILLLVQEVTAQSERWAHDTSADGWLSWRCSRARLLRSVRLAQAGKLTHHGSPARQAVRAPREANGVEQLTPREREVLAALMGGQDRDRIATMLAISPHTVRTHIQNIYGKLAVRNRLEAARVGLRAGLVPVRSVSSAQSAEAQ